MPPAFGAHVIGVLQSEYCHKVWCEKTRMVVSYQLAKKVWEYVIVSDRSPCRKVRNDQLLGHEIKEHGHTRP